MNGGVYQIINLTDPTKFYIGSAMNLNQRRDRHWFELRNNRHSNEHLQRAWNLHGADNFVFKSLVVCQPNELRVIEQRLLDKLHPHYNIALDALAPMSGRRHSTETIRRMMGNTYRLGHKHSEETKYKMSEAHKGKKPKPRTDEHRRNISNALKGKKASIETRRRMSKIRRGKKQSKETRQKIGNAQRRHQAKLRLERESHETL
jgi:group I intron endonuclease